MTEFATRTVFPFEPRAEAIALDAVATPYSTPSVFREQLADLSRLKYVRGRVRYRLELSGSSAGGAAKVRLTDGTANLLEDTLDLSTATEFSNAADVNPDLVSGSSILRWEVEVTAGADAGVTAVFAGSLLVDHPLVIGTC